MWEVDLEFVENLNCIHVNIWISGSLIVCGGNCFGRDEKAITQILSPTAQWKGQTEVQGRTYHCHLDLSLQVSVCGKSLPAKVAYNLTRASKNDQQKCSLQNEL